MKNFNPILFLASLGAGGIAVLPFILLQYTFPHGSGLITHSQVWGSNFSFANSIFYFSLDIVMIVFSMIHFILSVWLGLKLVNWIKNKKYGEIINDPLKNSSILTPLISLLMTMNLFIGPIRYFFPILSNNFQSLFLPAMIVWVILFIISIYLVLNLLGKSFKNKFEINNISFGWLLDSFLLLMLTVVGMGIAAMSQNALISHTASFLSLISGSMGAFILLVKIVTIFKVHFGAPGLPEKNLLPSFLIVIPIITLLGISLFRFGHFMERNLNFHLDSYFYIVTVVLFAFEIVYLLFGLSVLGSYFKKYHFNEYFDSQWSLICPMVAIGALAPFVYSVVYPNIIFYSINVMFLIISIFLYVEIFFKFLKEKRF